MRRHTASEMLSVPYRSEAFAEDLCDEAPAAASPARRVDFTRSPLLWFYAAPMVLALALWGSVSVLSLV